MKISTENQWTYYNPDGSNIISSYCEKDNFIPSYPTLDVISFQSIYTIQTTICEILTGMNVITKKWSLQSQTKDNQTDSNMTINHSLTSIITQMRNTVNRTKSIAQ